MLAFEHSVGYDLRGKLGVPLRFLSRTAQPPQHAIKFSLRKTSVKATKLERCRLSESRHTIVATTTWPSGKRPRWSMSDLRSSSSQRYYRDSTFTKR